MPITRPITCEEDITMTISTVIAGLMTKYSSNTRPVLGSMVANMVLGVNQIIEGANNMTFSEKAALRGELKTLCNRALRAPLGVVDANGGIIDAGKIDKE